MKILALEFSSLQRSVAVVQLAMGNDAAPGCAYEAVDSVPRSSNALGLVDEVLRAARLERGQIECLAVGLGPGSYAGIRSAIALAQGWELAGDVKLLGLSSVDCLAAQAQAEGFLGVVHVVIDAQRAEFYLASYEITAGGCRVAEPLRLAALTEVQERTQAGGAVIGPEVTKWFPGGRLIFPRAATLGRLAQRRADYVPGERLEPIYLRPTQFVKAPPPRMIPS